MLVDAVKSSFFGFVVSIRSFLGLGFRVAYPVGCWRGFGFVCSWVLWILGSSNL